MLLGSDGQLTGGEPTLGSCRPTEAWLLWGMIWVDDGGNAFEINGAFGPILENSDPPSSKLWTDTSEAAITIVSSQQQSY